MASSSRNWRYDVFPNFNGKDVRTTFLSHFLKELDRKLITSFEDNEIERSRHSIGSELIQAIKDSRIAVVVFSQNYASSSWCLDELVEISKCKEEFGQLVIPVFYHLDPSDVRKQTGEFGKIFQETCKNKTEEVKIQWKRALRDIANIGGYHSVTWGNEAKMIEGIANDILVKLRLTPRKDSEKLVGIEAHMAKMISLLELESEDVRMVGIWGPSGIGKTTIARVLYRQLSRRFQGSVYVDRALISKSMENYPSAASAKPLDYNMKLHLQKNILSEILGKRDIKIDHLGAVGKRLKCLKVLIFIDDFDDQVVQDALADQTYWFGGGSRIIVTAKDKRLLMAHRINHRYEVRLPSEVESGAGNLLNQNKEVRWQLSEGFNHFTRKLKLLTWEKQPSIGMASPLENIVNLPMRGSNLEKLWEGVHELTNLKKMDLWGSKNLKEIPGLSMATNLEFLNLSGCSSLVKLPSLEYLKLYQNLEVLPTRINLQSLSELDLSDCSGLWSGKREQLLSPLMTMLSPSLRTLKLEDIPSLVELPSSFKDLQKLVDLRITRCTNLETLPAGINLQSLSELDLRDCSGLWSGKREQLLSPLMIMLSPSLRTLKLEDIPSLVELPSSFKDLQKLEDLSITRCTNLETLPAGMNLKFLNSLDLSGCSRLRSFPDISTNISDLTLSCTAIEEVPWWIGKLARLVNLHMENCNKLEHVYMDISKLIHLLVVNFSSCWALAGADLSGLPSGIVMEADNSGTELPAHENTSYSLPDDFVPKVKLNFTNCVSLDQEALLQQQSVLLGSMILSGEEVPSYFTHRTFKNSLTNIPLLQRSPSQPLFRLRVCAVVDSKSISRAHDSFSIKICCRFIDRLGNHFDSVDWALDFWKTKLGSQLFIFDCCFPLHEDNAPLAELKYDHVDIQFRLIDNCSQLKLKGCGVRFLEDGPSMDDSNNSTDDNLGGLDTEHCKEFGDSTVMMSSLHNWVYHVFLSFSGEDACIASLIDSLKKMDQKLIIAFNDNEMERRQSISPELVHTIKDSRIAVVVFSKNYASSSWCLNELVEILKCKEKLGQTVIPIFYGLDPYDIRKQSGDFGELFENTCKNKTKELKNRWRVALTDAANISGYHSVTWDNEAKMIEEIANDVLSKLNLTPTMKQIEMSHDHDSYCSRQEELHEVDSETDGILWDAKLYVNAKDTESVQGGAKFNEKSIRGDNFLGEVNSDATSNSQKVIANKMVGPVKGEKHGKLSKSSTMVTYKRQMSQHQVFINFWGEEVRFSFICHLVSAFSREGVNTYIGNYEKRVEDLRKTFQTIEESNIALVVFSSRYTESRWCLDELVKIKERLDEGKLLIIPIFYEVKPSQVQQLEGDFGLRLWNLWRIHRDHRIIKWKDALEYVASGMDFCLKEHRSESEFITLIVEKVVSRIALLQGENPSFISTSGRGKTTELSTIIGEKHENVPNKCPLFGLEQRMKQLEEKLEFNCNKTQIIGVVGMAGIGKTTLAMMLHEKWNCKFVRCVPLLGIRKMAEDHKPAWLRKTLLEVLLGGKFPVINDKMTHESLKDKLLQTKVFIVLDDVSDKKQLKFLLSDLNWIKNGSKIVITSRDKSLIEEFVHDTYVVPPLNYGEALQLFSYHAFSDHVVHPSVTSTKLCREFLDCAGGNPLIIKLLGKELHGRDEAQWEIRQEDLTHLAMLILNIFRSSCDELSAKQKDVFLDIACFFRSENDYFVRTLLDSGDHNTTDAESEVRDLTHKCMIAISGGRVEVHDLLYMFGKIFSSQAFIEENGGQSRLWYTQEIIDSLINQKDTKRMRGIFLDMSEVTEAMVLPRLTFLHMINLRYLKIDNSCCPRPCKALCKLHCPEGLKFTLEKVRYLHWVNFPLKELPSDFRPENLVDLRLPYSMVERVWQGVKDTPQLKWVDLSHSNNLLNLSGLAKAESLLRLNLEGCTDLDELPGEMQNMKSLVYLNLRGCTRLSSLPKMNLISLKTLILSKCSNLEVFQVISKSLEVLHLDGTAIKRLPQSIKNLQRLVLFNLKNCKMLVSLPNCLGELIVLEELILSGCSRLKNLPDVEQSMKHVQILLLDGTGAKEMPNISCFTGSNGQVSVDMLQPSGSYLSEWPRGFDGVYSLRRLCLSGNDFVSLQNDIRQLYNLTWLDVKQCTKLRSVPMLPPRLQYFDAHGCDSLEKVANPLAVLVLTEQVHAKFNFSNCNKLDQDAQDSIISYTRRRSQLMLGALSRYNGGFTLEPLVGTCFPGWDVPEWFSHRGSGSVLQPKQPPHWCDNRSTGIALCAVIVFPGYHEQRNRLLVNCKCEFENEEGSSIHFSCTVGCWNELSNTPQKMELSHVFIGYTSRLDISTQGGYDEGRCFCTKSSFEFQVTDGTKKVEGCEVLQCGFSLVYATDDRENICLDAKTVAVPKTVKNFPAEEMSYGNSRRDDDIQYQSYSGPTMRTHESFLSERKSDAKKNLRKSFENKRFDLFKNPGGEITISSNHHNKPTENVEKPSLVGVEEKPSLVGVELCLKQLEKVLYSTPGKTRIVGVIGMPGIGKTTLANILFEKHGCKFPRSFSLTVSKEYISEELKKTYLEELLEHTQNIREETTDESLKDNPLQTKVFVVLENVSDKKQLEFLLSNLNWIKKGSKIVVTACDKSLVEGLAHETYVVPQLNNKEAFQVFSYHAFDGKICIPTETFQSLSKLFVDNVGGNPLDLKLLGSELCGKDEAYWKHKLQTVKQISNTKIQDVWRFYTDQLTQRHKDVLLDIACFFRSEDEYFIRSLMDSGDPDSTDGVSEVRDLAEKFLITICDGRVEINDQDYTSCKNLGSPEGLRLMKHKDILDKLRETKQQEANTVRGVFFDMSELIQSIALERTTFFNMHDLRYLKIYESCCSRKGKSVCKLQFPDGLDFPLEEVRYFHWLKYPLEELPPDFRPENLVDLRLPYSKVKHLWEGVKDTPRLKWVDLSHSSKLLNLSALSKAESLQRLDLEGCTSLKELPGDMKNMKSLVYLNLRGCLRLRSLPKTNLISLKTLILSDCSNLKEFQVISESLEVLHLDGTAIEGLPLSILKLQRLVVLNLKNCKMLECLPNFLGKLKVLEEIILSGCSKLKNLPDVRHSMKHVQILLFDGAGVDEMPNISCFIGSQGQEYGNPSEWPRCVNRVSSLRRLCLSGNDFVSLQNDIGKLNNLIWLDVKQCKKLRSVPMLPPRLQHFDAHGCGSLERVANPLALQVVTEQIHANYNFSNCNKLDQDATDAIISYTRWKSELILNSLSRYNGGFALQALVGTCFPGWEVPAWFSYRASGSLLEPKLPPHWCNSRFTGIALCAVILFPAYRNQRNNLLVKCNLELKNEDGSRSRFSFPVGGWNEPGETIDSSHVFIGYASKLDIKKLREDNEEGCIHTEASFEFQVTDGTKELKGCKVLKCGFSLVYESDELQVNSGEHETTTKANQDITSSTWIQDFFGYIFLAFSCVIVLAILGFCVRVFAPQYYMSFSDFSWPLLARTLFFVAYGLFLKAEKTKPIS